MLQNEVTNPLALTALTLEYLKLLSHFLFAAIWLLRLFHQVSFLSEFAVEDI